MVALYADGRLRLLTVLRIVVVVTAGGAWATDSDGGVAVAAAAKKLLDTAAGEAVVSGQHAQQHLGVRGRAAAVGCAAILRHDGGGTRGAHAAAGRRLRAVRGRMATASGHRRGSAHRHDRPRNGVVVFLAVTAVAVRSVACVAAGVVGGVRLWWRHRRHCVHLSGADGDAAAVAAADDDGAGRGKATGKRGRRARH